MPTRRDVTASRPARVPARHSPPLAPPVRERRPQRPPRTPRIDRTTVRLGLTCPPASRGDFAGRPAVPSPSAVARLWHSALAGRPTMRSASTPPSHELRLEFRQRLGSRDNPTRSADAREPHIYRVFRIDGAHRHRDRLASRPSDPERPSPILRLQGVRTRRISRDSGGPTQYLMSMTPIRPRSPPNKIPANTNPKNRGARI